MASRLDETFGARGITHILRTTLATDGSAGHRYAGGTTLTAGRQATANLADAVHFLGVLHGRLPSLVDLAALKTQDRAPRIWLNDAATEFALERTYLTKLVAAAGPLPSTAGQAESEAAVVAQHHAVEMLARSDRAGTAIGAAIALILDWQVIRRMLDVAAARFGFDPPASTLPEEGETLRVAASAASTPGIERAMLFGANQILIQHRGLWDLLEARELARRDR